MIPTLMGHSKSIKVCGSLASSSVISQTWGYLSVANYWIQSLHNTLLIVSDFSIAREGFMKSSIIHISEFLGSYRSQDDRESASPGTGFWRFIPDRLQKCNGWQVRVPFSVFTG